MNDRNALENSAPPPGAGPAPAERVESPPAAGAGSPPAVGVGSPPAGYAGRPRDAQLEYKAILANASIGIAFTRDRRIFLCNPMFAEIFGWKAEELIGQSGEVVYPSRESYEAMGTIAIPILGSGRQLDVEWEMRRKDGSTFLCRVIAKAISETNTQAGTVWIAEDITGRKKHADEAARLLREQNAILDTASIGICFVRERVIVRCNRRMEEMYGYAAGDLNGKPTSVIYAEESDYALAEQGYREMARGQTNTRVIQARRRDGTVFWQRSTSRAVDPADPARGSVWLLEDITERKRTDGEIQRMVREQDLILGNAAVGIAFVRNQMIQRCNRFLEEMVGAEPGALAGQLSKVLFASEEDWNQAGRLAYSMTVPGGAHDAEWRFKRADGSTFLCRTRGRRIDSGGGDQEWIWSFEDVTLEREAEARVQRALAEQELILANATVGISFARQRVFQRCNPRFEQMFGYGPGEMVGKSTAFLFGSGEDYEAAGARMYAQLATGSAFVVERELRRRDGSMIWCKVVIKAIDPAHPEEGAIGIYEDITAERAARATLEASRDALERAVAQRTEELQSANRRLQVEIADRRQAETRAQHLADHDALTGLPNRRLLEDRLTQALALSQRNRKQTAVMFIDLDRFKIINDTLGHSAGDQVLKEVAERLIAQLREIDTICRMGGDEFVVVLPEIKRASDAANVAAKILETVSQPFAVQDRTMHITPSIGISVFPDDGRDAATLIRNADAAMYHAKEIGRADYQFFTEQMNQSASKRLALESDLRQAALKGEMRVYYQPVVDPGSGLAVAHEALLRWQHASRGIIEPADFIHLAEDTGIIIGLGEWVLAEACRWGNFIGTERGLPVSVNLSSRQFNDPRIAELVARVLNDSGLPPQLLELEIPEAVAMQQPDFAVTVLKKLKDLGVRLALDDFGIGLSGVAHLRRFPVDRLKIDRSLVSQVTKGADHDAVVAAIAGLGHALGLKVVAKGVETEAQKAMLVGCGCDYLQGFLTGAPVDADTAAKEYV